MFLTPRLVEGFTQQVLLKNFDNPLPIPEFHKILWKYCCLDDPRVAIAAPRGHAKSTAVTFAWTLCVVLFRFKQHILIVSDTEPQAIQFLQNIKQELQENEFIRSLFKIRNFIKENEREIIVEMGEDRYQFRIIVRSSMGSVRGFIWRHRRPDLAVCDDLENDELVMNKDRREKFSKWMFGALFPSLSDKGIIRIVGTILHFDSFLESLMPKEKDLLTITKPLWTYSKDNDSIWKAIKFRAHPGFDDFSQILWQEKFSEKRLRFIRQDFVNKYYAEGYSQEYLNYPLAELTSYFRREDFLPMEPKDYLSKGPHYAAIDFAISTDDRANRTAIVVGKVDENHLLHIVDGRAGRWDSKQIIDEMLSIRERYNPEIFVAEKGSIERAIGPFLEDEMLKRNLFINIHKEAPDTDKQRRARSIQGRLRSGAVRFDKESSWYPDLEQEMLRFDRDDKDDYVDAMAWLGFIVNKMIQGPTVKELEEEEYKIELFKDPASLFTGRNQITGY